MIQNRSLMIVDLSLNILLATATITYAIYVIKHMKIRLNRITRIKWFIALISILLRLALTIVEFAK